MTAPDASAVAELVKRLRHQSEEAYFAGYCDDADHLTEAATLLEQQSAHIAELDFLNAGLSCMAERNEDADKKYEARLQEQAAEFAALRTSVQLVIEYGDTHRDEHAFTRFAYHELKRAATGEGQL